MGKPLTFQRKLGLLLTLGCTNLTSLNTCDAFHPTSSPVKFKYQHQNLPNCCSTIGGKITTTCRHMEPTTIGGGIVAAALASAAVYFSGSEEREKRKQYAEWEEKDRQLRAERARLAYIAPRDYWAVDDLRPYDGTNDDESGPILMGVNGEVYNVWKGRHFYGPGCEYHIFAGRDATRLLAKSKLEEETEEELERELTIGERAALQGWIYTFKTKYEVVGKLEGFDPSSTTTRTT